MVHDAHDMMDPDGLHHHDYDAGIQDEGTEDHSGLLPDPFADHHDHDLDHPFGDDPGVVVDHDTGLGHDGTEIDPQILHMLGLTPEETNHVNDLADPAEAHDHHDSVSFLGSSCTDCSGSCYAVCASSCASQCTSSYSS